MIKINDRVLLKENVWHGDLKYPIYGNIYTVSKVINTQCNACPQIIELKELSGGYSSDHFKKATFSYLKTYLQRIISWLRKVSNRK